MAGTCFAGCRRHPQTVSLAAAPQQQEWASAPHAVTAACSFAQAAAKPRPSIPAQTIANKSEHVTPTRAVRMTAMPQFSNSPTAKSRANIHRRFCDVGSLVRPQSPVDPHTLAAEIIPAQVLAHLVDTWYDICTCLGAAPGTAKLAHHSAPACCKAQQRSLAYW
jgi:hypothetical protein